MQILVEVPATLKRPIDVVDLRTARGVVFGSRARGDSHADSDLDVAVFMGVARERAAIAQFERLRPAPTGETGAVGA